MKSVFHPEVREELISRIGTLNNNSVAQWGSMNVYQMLEHCARTEEMYLGKSKYKRIFISYLIGRIALKNVLKGEAPLMRNAKSLRAFQATGDGDIAAGQRRWVGLIQEYEHYREQGINHWFFGKMTKEQIGYFVYKHADHHLRQFAA